MNISTGRFVLDIVTRLLNKSLSSEEYYKIGGSKNIFRRCVERNKGIGDTCSEALSNLIVKETKHDELKKKLILDYLKQFLTVKEKNYIKRNPTDIKTIVKFTTVKFTAHNNSVPDLGNVQYFDLSTDGNFRVVGVRDLISMGWNFEDIVNETIKIDYETINDITLEHNGDNDQWVQVVHENPETLRFLVDENAKAIGYYYFIPLFEDVFQKAKEGQLFDSEITVDKVPFLLQGTYDIYFIVICLRETYRKTFALRQMLFSVMELFEEMASNGIFINEICTQAYSDSGIALCKSIGLKYLKNHIDKGTVYHGTIMDILEHPLYTKFSKLKEMYTSEMQKYEGG